MAERGEQKFGFLLSLTGYLSLQEKKDRKGRLNSTKKGQQKYWFWFDEKECVLKYYKNKESYIQYLHTPLGKISMDDSKVTPAAAYEHATNEDTSNTFIVLTQSGQYFALTAQSAETCHDWIRKLQAKRTEWIKKDSNIRKTLPRTISPRHYEQVSGLVGGERSFGNSLGGELLRTTGSGSVGVRKIFIDQLEGKLSPYSEYQDPFESDRLLQRTETASSYASSTNYCQTETDGIREGEGEREEEEPGRKSLCNSDDSGGRARGGSGQGSFITSTGELTEHGRRIFELEAELSESRFERDQLKKQSIQLQEKLFKKDERIKNLQDEVDKLKETIHKIKSPNSDYALENENLRVVIESLQKSLKSLDGEVELHKLKLKERNSELDLQKDRMYNVQKDLMSFKAKYVTLLSSSFKIQTPTPAGLTSTDDMDPFEEKLKDEVINLITEEDTSSDSFLGTIKTQANFEDQFGDIHDWKGDGNIHHFLCRQLYLHYTAAEQEMLSSVWQRYVDGLKKGSEQYRELPTDRTRKREFRNYLRKGIPLEFRSQIWSSVINHHIGKYRDVKNYASKNGSYYQSCLENPSAFNKQINLDLHRTLPNNRHFKTDGTGVEKLQRILTAFCNHNKNIGYCQGMNMLAAIGLLFLDEETAFWYLVTVIEKLMPSRYFSDGLSAAQADQLVLKELIQNKLPLLNEHLLSNDIDVTIVTFNWFLTLFIDALPTESMLRIIDVFLYEGRKVLFRFSLSVLKLYERRILSMFDPVTIFQFIKEVAKHIFNVEELFKIAFNDFEPFPRRSTINNKCQPFAAQFYDEYQERLKQKRKSLTLPNKAINQPSSSLTATTSFKAKARKQFQWECACIVNEREVWLCCGERQIGKVCIVSSTGENGFDTNSPSLNVGSKILCISAIPNDIVMIGTLDFSIHAVSAKTRKELWSKKMNDSVLDFVGCDRSLLCALADGYIAVLATSGVTPPELDPLLYRIGNTAVQAIIWTPFKHIWCGCGKAITVISSETHEPVKPVVMPDNAGKVYHMELGPHGIWVTFKSSTIICLYDTRHMIKLLQVDYPQILQTKLSVSEINKGAYRIIVATPIDDLLWIGTGNASIHIFSINSIVTCPEDSIVQIARQSHVIDSAQVEKSLQARPVSDEGLVSMTTPTDDHTQPVSYRKKNFGKTFRRQIKREAVINDSEPVYELYHLSSSRVLPDSQECSRVTILKPIKYEGQLFVISCVNSSSVVEKAVQLWQCSSTLSPNHWNYTCIPECYECVTKDWYPAMMSSLTNQPSPHPLNDRSRTYSTILGAPPIND